MDQKCVLIVEDEPTLLMPLALRLRKEKLKVLEAEDGESGLKLAFENHPDLIILDILMLKMDGLTALEHLRQDPWGKNVPVLVFSNVDDSAILSAALKLNVSGYVIKSNISIDGVAEKVKKLLDIWE